MFYKFTADFKQISFGCRKQSVVTMASSSDEESSNLNIASDSWCSKCEEFYRTCQKLAAASGFKLMGSMYSNDLSFRCPAQKHLTKISYSRRHSSSLTCSGCKKDERESAKAKIKREDDQRHAEFATMQDQIFRKAQAALDEELRSGKPTYLPESAFPSLSGLDQSNLTAQVEQRARALSNSYCRSNPAVAFDQDSQEKTYLVYKCMESPHELLVHEMRAVNPSILPQFHRKLMKQLHPDKNGHPRAKEAFLKVQEAYASVKALIPDSRSFNSSSTC